MTLVTGEVLEKYGNLASQQKRVLRSLSEDKSDGEVAQMLGLQPANIGELVQRIIMELGLPSLGSHYARKQLLVEVQRRHALLEAEQEHGGPGSILAGTVAPPMQGSEGILQETGTAESGDEALAVGDAGSEASTPILEARIPSVEDLLPKVDRLKDVHLDTLRTLEKLGYRDTAGMAKSLGIGPQSVYNRLNKICAELGITHLPLKEARRLLYQVMGRRKALQDSKMGVAELVPAQPTSESPAPAQLLAPVVELERVAPAESPVPAEPSLHPQPQGGGSVSPGVVIQLPSDVVNIDVVAGTFNGGAPSRDMAKEVQQRKEKGLKPTFLVLSPMQGDPTTTLAQLVFIEQDK